MSKAHRRTDPVIKKMHRERMTHSRGKLPESDVVEEKIQSRDGRSRGQGRHALREDEMVRKKKVYS